MSDIQQAPRHWPEGFDAAPIILLVDDEPNILGSIRRLLRNTGYMIMTAENGEQALEILQGEPIDLIISDMRMPNMNGAELLDQVRQRWPWTIRVLLTGHSDITSAISAINQGGIYRYISKPWNDDEIFITIRSAVERRGLEKEHKRLQVLTQQQNEDLKNLNLHLEQKVQERTLELAKSNEELTHSNERIKHNFLTSIKVFSNLIEMRTGFFPGHSRRVGDLSRKIADQMGLSRSLSQTVLLAGLLHGIGKIGLPDALMTKPLSQMNSDELDTFKKHPLKGATALLAIDELCAAAALIRQQHERYDDPNFVEGLTGAGILAVAIDYDATQLGLRTPKKLNPDEAREWIVKGKGSMYAPNVVSAFLDIMGRSNHSDFKTKCMPSHTLKPGMILERDLITHEGVLLMNMGDIFDDVTIDQIRSVETTEKIPLKIWIRCL